MSNVSAALTNFFHAEIRNEESMRREVAAPGSDEYDATFDPASDLHVPDATLASALDSWDQAPDDVRADWCQTNADPATLQGIEDELRSLVTAQGPGYPLVDLLA